MQEVYSCALYNSIHGCKLKINCVDCIYLITEYTMSDDVDYIDEYAEPIFENMDGFKRTSM